MRYRVPIGIDCSRPKVVTQNPREFSVQILDDKEAVVGTGIIISKQGHILTCEHVISAAGIDVQCRNNYFEDATVEIYLPNPIVSTQRNYKAKVEACLFGSKDDIVLLRIVDDLQPWSEKQIAVLGTAKFSGGNKFRSYGFGRLGGFPSCWVQGCIEGSVLPLEDEIWLVDPIELQPETDVRPGMSGAGVLDMQRNLVVGLITRRWVNSFPGERLAWAVDNVVLLKFDSAFLEVIDKFTSLE